MKLKQCPFCGYLAEFCEKTEQAHLPSGLKSGAKMISYWVECGGCGLKTSTVCANENYNNLSKLRQGVIGQWNKIAEALEDSQ